MRIFLLMIMSLSLMAEVSFSIEVLSVKDKGEISDAFMEKVNAMDLPFTTHHSKGNYRVLVGDFKSVKEAEKILADVQVKVNEKAFITTGMDIVEVDPQQKMVQAMIMAQARALRAPKEEVKRKISQGIEIKAPEGERLMKKRKKMEVLKKEIFCTSSKKALREAQIAQALTFYRNSSYYSFSN